jgi:hypothetical protein
MILNFHEKAMSMIKQRVPITRIREISQISMMMKIKEDPKGIDSILEIMKDTENALEVIALDYGFSLKELK